MSAKFSASRKQAFLSALRATGNQTLAAERTKVSRSWVQLQRSEDASFRSAVEQAVAEARAMLRAEPLRGVPGGPAYADGAELVVRGTGGSGGGKRVQVARSRLRQWTPRVEERFLAALAFLGMLQITAAVLNLLPVPGLDGYGIIEPWLSAAARRQMRPFAPFGLLIVIAALWTPKVNVAFFDFVDAITNALGAPGYLADYGYSLFRFWGDSLL